jgi:WD40 repeat protein
MQKGRLVGVLIGVVLSIAGLVTAQQPDTLTPVLTAENIAQLQPAARIDLPASDYDTGWFAMSDDGELLLIRDKTNNLHLMRHSGEIIHTIQPSGDFRDAAFGENQVAAVFSGEDTIQVETYDFTTGDIQRVTLARTDYPAAVWFTDETLWLELLPDNPDEQTTVYQVPVAPVTTEYELPYSPADDPDAIVRIGRISPPYVVTSSAAGIVKLWNLQTGKVIYEVDNGLKIPTTFGNINTSTTKLIWRDEMSALLYLLDFETGENRVIGRLNGEYAQWFFVSDDASVILAVNLNFEPAVVAWDTSTGEKYALGDYRVCNRPQPDMARLSRDGTTLVIGCDTGLDIWRIPSNPAN